MSEGAPTNRKSRLDEAAAALEASAQPASAEEIQQIETLIDSEVSSAVRSAIENLAGATKVEQEAFLAELRAAAEPAIAQMKAAGTSESDIEQQLTELQEHIIAGNIVGLNASGNPFAKIAHTKIITAVQKATQQSAERIAELEVTKRFGIFADPRNMPGLSVMEIGGRVTIEAFIAYVAYRSAENATFLALSQMDFSSNWTADWRRLIAVAVAGAASYGAFKFRHNIYRSAQDFGADLRDAGKSVIHPQRLAGIGVRTAMAAFVAFAGTTAIINVLAGGQKSGNFGATAEVAINGVQTKVETAGTILGPYFDDLVKKTRDIVLTETGEITGVAGAGRSAGRGYGPKAAHKDFLFNGTYRANDFKGTLDPALKAFRTDTLKIPEGVSVADHIKKEWEKSGFHAQLTIATREINELKRLVALQKAKTLTGEFVNTTLKQVDDPRAIPNQVARTITEIEKLVKEYKLFKVETDRIFEEINKRGLQLAKAAGEGIQVSAPDLVIETTELTKLPAAPGSRNSIWLTPDDTKEVIAFLKKQPGFAWFGTLVEGKDADESQKRLILSFMAIYLGVENLANLIFALRELRRRRREKKEIEGKDGAPGKLHDIYRLEDEITTELALGAMRFAPLYKDALTRHTPDQALRTLEQLKAQARVFLRERADAVDPHLPDEPTALDRWAHRLDHISNILVDRGPERIRHVDAYIGELESIKERGSTSEGFAALLAESGLPGGASAQLALDEKLQQDPVAFESALARRETRAFERRMNFLIQRIQARNIVLGELKSHEETRTAQGTAHLESATKFWSGGVLLSLDGKPDTVAVGVDDARFFEMYARLANEQRRDEFELYDIALRGRTVLERSLTIDRNTRQVVLPPQFQITFVRDALSRPLSIPQGMLDAYRREIQLYASNREAAGRLSEQLTAINEIIPDVLNSVSSLPETQGADVRGEYAYSAAEGGPVFRVSVYRDTGERIATAEYPKVIPQPEANAPLLAREVSTWFASGNPGALEVEGRILHSRLKQSNEQFAGVVRNAIGQNTLNETLRINLQDLRALDSTQIEQLARLSTFTTLLDRQKLRLNNMRANPMTSQELRLFKVPEKWTREPSNVTIDELLRDATVLPEGIFGLANALPLFEQILPGHKVTFDFGSRRINITRPMNISQGALLPVSKDFGFEILNDLSTAATHIRKELAAK